MSNTYCLSYGWCIAVFMASRQSSVPESTDSREKCKSKFRIYVQLSHRGGPWLYYHILVHGYAFNICFYCHSIAFSSNIWYIFPVFAHIYFHYFKGRCGAIDIHAVLWQQASRRSGEEQRYGNTVEVECNAI